MEKSVIRNRNLHIIFSITLVAVMGVASITPAFPAIIDHFGIEKKQVVWLITMFTIPGIVLTPIMGVLADRFGRKTILIPSLILFSLGGTACIAANTFHILLVYRFIQGTGAAALGSLNITLVGDMFTGKQRAEAMGYNASVLSVGTASYPFIGGLLAHANWNYPFLLPFLAIPCALWVATTLKNPEPKEKQELGQYLINTWGNINKPKVWGVFTINVLIFVILYGAYLSFFPLLMKDRFGSGSLEIGLFMSAFSVCTAITASQSKHIHQLISVRIQLIVSFCFYILGLVILSFVSSYIILIIPLVIIGIAHGMVIPGIQNILVGFAPLKERAGFMSINSMVLRIGQTIGPPLIGVFFAFGGFSLAFLGGSVIAVIALIIWLLMKEI